MKTQNKPLDGQILITAPKGYSERFQYEFRNSYLKAIAIPMINTEILEDIPSMDSLIINLKQYDYIVFSSRKAIESFHLAIQKYPDIQKDLVNYKFCSIGKDTEYLYEKLHVSPAIFPDEPSPMGIAAKLAENKDIIGQHIAVLVPKVEIIKEPDVVPQFITKLVDIGLHVTRIDAYITKPAKDSEIEKTIELIASGQIKCIAFTSSAEIEVLLMKDSTILDHVTIACFGPYTANYAKSKGLKVSLISKDFNSFVGFIKAIERHYNQ